VDETALVKGSVVELANGEALEGGIANDNTIISMEYVADADEKAKFIGKAVGDKVVFNPKAAAKGVTTEIASMLNIEKEAAEGVENDFEFTIKEIIVLKLAEKNQELYDEVFGADKVHNEEEYDVELRKMIAGQLRLDSNYRFTIDAQDALVKAVGEVELPEEFLKKWLVKTNEKVTAENVDEEYARMKPAASWQLIKEVIVEQQGIKVEDDDLLREAKILAVQQFAQYGMSNVPDEYVDRYAEDFLKNDEYRRRLADKAIDDKIFSVIRENADVEEKEVSAEEFNKLFA
ncbi:MAG: trigger factor, partial [Bacteroidales bacterium]|nr:trigger factor [Bacteroidales bacterium]